MPRLHVGDHVYHVSQGRGIVDEVVESRNRNESTTHYWAMITILSGDHRNTTLWVKDTDAKVHYVTRATVRLYDKAMDVTSNPTGGQFGNNS